MPARASSPHNEELRAAVRVASRLSRLLERSCGGLSLAQYRVLSAVASGEERASRVAARLALGKPAVSASVETLAQRRLLLRQAGEEDQRVIRLEVTVEGQKLLDEVEHDMATRLSRLAERSGAPGAVYEALGLLGRAIEDEARERR